MSKKYICIHGHFYQPPRENPWLNKVEIQDSAYPYHDWNHRIDAECYKRNASSRILNEEGNIEDIMNNYGGISFNIGPTLLAWMKTESPGTYKAILEADRQSQKRFSGHGSALAQAFNHMIMPLASERDQETQVIWGIEDFRHRFKRDPEGMWLGETAINTTTLEIMARHNIKFTILSPYQAKQLRKIGEEEWQDATNAKIDTQRAYRCNLPSGNSIDLFFYAGPASQAVAFEGLLNDGKRFAERLYDSFSEEKEEVQLVHIATDGESYGHHHELGEMALSYCLHYIDSEEEAELTIYGEFLEKHPPEYEVQILENSSWSCYHGVERWRNDCGCNTGGNKEWNQKWRKPLRETFDWIREELVIVYEEAMKKYSDDPWKIRDRYIEVVLDRDKVKVRSFLKENCKKNLEDEEIVEVLKLLEMQYHTMLMYTSCGWFFDEVTGIESMQDIFYAKRALQLAEDVSGLNFEDEFVKRLEMIPSNLSEYNSVKEAYFQYVKPMALNMVRIGAHYAVSSIFEEFPEKVSLYNFSASVKTKYSYEAGKQKLIIGRTDFRSDITWETVDISFAVLYMGDQYLYGGVRKYMGEEPLEEIHESMVKFFKKGNVYEIFNLMDIYFGNHNYSFRHLFRDEQRSIMELVMRDTLRKTDFSMQQIYEDSFPLLQTIKDVNMTIPNRLKMPVDLAVNNKLIKKLEYDTLYIDKFRRLLKTAEEIDVSLDLVTLDFLSDNRLSLLMEKFKENHEDQELLDKIVEFVKVISASALNPKMWDAQNICFEIKEQHYSKFLEERENGNKVADSWISSFKKLAEEMNLVIE